MNLFIHIAIHIFISILIAIFTSYFLNNLVISIISALIGGVLVDLDHFIDYYFSFGFKRNLQYFLTGYQFLKSDRLFIYFHSFEIFAVLIILGFAIKENEVKVANLSLGFSGIAHLLTDSIINQVPIKSYFFFYRLINKFRIKSLVSKK